MNPILIAQLRRYWQIFGALGVFAAFFAAHMLIFRPAVSRYQNALRKSGELGVVFDPNHVTRSLPPRVFALLTNNALPAREAEQRASSGLLGAELLQDLSRIASHNALELEVTEPGPVVQQPGYAQVRAHLKMRGRYPNYVSFMDELARSGALYAIERFTLTPSPNGMHSIEIDVSRLVLKQTKAAP